MVTEMSHLDLTDLRYRLRGFTRQDCAALCGVSLITYNRWEAGKTRVPLSAFRLMELLCGENLGLIHKAWKGWRLGVNDGLIYTDDMKIGFSPGHIRAIPFRQAQITELAALLRVEKDVQRDMFAPVDDVPPETVTPISISIRA